MRRRRFSVARLNRWLKEEIDAGQLLGLSSDDRAALAWQAHRRLEAGQFADAARIFHLLRFLEPKTDVTSLLGEGVCFQAQGKLGQAENSYRQVLEIAPENIFALANRAEVCLLTNRAEAALADLAAAQAQLDRAGAPAVLRSRVEHLQAIAQSSPDGNAPGREA
jgi:Flp pilus assembly protein TadD